MDIFISYSWNDTITCRAIAAELKLNGMRPLYDARNLRATETIHSGISRLLDTAVIVIALLTPSSMKSFEVLDELSRANERGKNIIPFVHEDCDQRIMPHFLRDHLQIRYTEHTFDLALQKLVEEIADFMDKLKEDEGDYFPVERFIVALPNEEKMDLHSYKKPFGGQRLVSELPRTMRGTVLDLGSGCGIIGLSAANLGADQVVLIDIVNAECNISRENARLNNLQVSP